MTESQTEFNRQFPPYFPRILDKPLECIVGDIVDPVEVCFLIVAQISGQHIRITVTVRKAVRARSCLARVKLQVAVRKVTGGLCASDSLIKEFSPKRVGAPYLSDRVAHT